jgi:hypothetical protein
MSTTRVPNTPTIDSMAATARIARRALIATAFVVVALIGIALAGSGAAAASLARPSTLPANDDLANAEVLVDRFGWISADTTDATKEPGEPNHAGNAGGASIWYAWTAPYSGPMTVSLCWSEFDTLLAVYTGDQLIDLQAVTADDDGCGDQSRVSFMTSAGVTYKIAVDGAEASTGYVDLEWGLSPANDDFSAAADLGGDGGTVSGDNRYATLEAGEPDHGQYSGRSVWYRWTAPSSGPATFDLCESSFDTILAVYTGVGVGGLTRVAADDNGCPDYYGARISFIATGGQEYRIAAVGAYGDWGNLTLTWSRIALAPRIHVSPSIVGLAVDGAMLTATVGEWGGTPPLTFGYQWARCTLGGSFCQSIPGANSASFVVRSADVSGRLRVFVTASNAGGSTTAESEPTDIVAPAPPANVTPPRILDAAYVGALLTVDEGQWSGTQPFAFTYQWQRCGATGCADIEGETDASYMVRASDLNRRLIVIVTATNGAGSATAASTVSRRAARRPACVVPRVKGKSLAVARRAIRRANCAIGRVRQVRSRRAKGRVLSQSPRAGARKPVRAKVSLVVSRGRR